MLYDCVKVFRTNLKLDTTGGKHHYISSDGKRFPSVTTVLGATKSEKAKEGLRHWQTSVGYGVAEYIVREAATIGSETHALIEDFLNGADPDKRSCRLISRAHFAKFRPTLDLLTDIKGVEIPVYSAIHQVAGTVDAIATLNGEPTILDYKTKRSRQRMEWMSDYFLQAAAYSMMYAEVTGTEPISNLTILVSTEQDTYQAFTSTYAENIQEFLSRLATYKRHPPKSMKVP